MQSARSESRSRWDEGTSRPGLVCLLVLGLTVPALAQDAGGAISGVVSGATGPLQDAVVRARNLDTDVAVEVHSAADGSYTLRLPAGSYDFFASLPLYRGYVQRDIEIQDSAALHIDAKLIETQNLGVPGEGGFALLGLEEETPEGAAPRAADGHPDLSGVWFPSDPIDPEEIPYRPWARTLQQQRAADFTKDDPRAKCLPSGVPRTMRFDLTKLIQTPDLLVILIEGTPPGYRQVFLDGREHPADFQPSWMGHSTGSWEGDTLVVDSVGFNDRGWIDIAGSPQTEELHVIERLHRPDLGHMDVEITIDDPGAYERPWKIRRSLELAGGYELLEYVCNENEKPEHIVGAGTQ